MFKVLSSLLIVALAAPWLSYARPASNPSKWQRIYPVKGCMNFHLMYIQQNNQYYLTYPLPDGKYKDPYIIVKSISDLSGISDVIAAEANQKCQMAIKVAPGEACNPLDHLEKDFLKLVQDAANVVGKIGDKCKELTKYLELHDKITALDSKNPVQITEASNVGNAILKIFASSKDGQLIDHFEVCGGKAQSHKFVENLLLMESSKSCIMPNPPGILSWDEMRKIAARIGMKYKNKSILSIRDDQPNIEKDALLEITRVASLKQIKELMPKLDANKSLESLNSYKSLKEARNMKELKDYIKLVYTPNASIEIAEESLQGVVRENMMEKLPRIWSQERKENYIKSVLMPKAMAGFNECMEGPKKRANYGHKTSPIINLNYRNWQKKEFCKQHKNACLQLERPGCTSSKVGINVLSMDPEVSDAEVAKSCALNGMSRVIEPIFSLILNDQVESFKNDVKLPPDLAERFAESAWNQFKSCINTHEITKKQFGKKSVYQPIYHPEGTNEEAFRKMSPDQFKTLYGDCSDSVEQKLTRDFVEVVFISNENITQNNPLGPMMDFHGTRYPAAAVIYTQQTVKKNMDRCYEQQRIHHKNRPNFKPSPTICSPLMEVEVARSIIDSKLNQIFKEKNLTQDADAKNILTDFNVCSYEAYHNIISSISNPDAVPPLSNSDDVKSFMRNDKKFYNCVEASLSGTAKLIGGKEFKSSIIKNKSSLKNYNSILAMEKDVKDLVKNCFENEIRTKAGSWPGFKNYNAADGIATSTEICTKAANKYAVPRIMLKETITQVQQVKKDGLLNSESEVNEAIQLAAADMKQALGIQIDPKIKGDPYLITIFGEGLSAYEAKNPKATQDDYLNYFKKKITSRVIEKVHGRLIQKIKSKAQSQFNLDLSALDTTLTKSCVIDIYNSLSNEKNPKSKNSDPLDLDDLTSQIAEGFQYLKLLPAPAFDNQMAKIKNVCQNAKSLSSMEDLIKSGLLNFIVKAQIRKKTIEALKKMAIESQSDDLKKYNRTHYYTNVRPFIDKKFDDTNKLIREKLEDVAAFDKMMFPSPIIGFALDNLDDATKDGSSANKRLNQMVMEQMFKDRSKYGFASRFSEIQIVNSVGMEGYKEAELGIHSSLKNHSNIPTTVFTVAKKVLNRNWTPKKVHERIFWYDLPDFARDSLVSAVYTNAIVPITSGENSTTIANEKSKLGKAVASHVDGWHKDGKVFKEVFTEEIERETTAEIKKNHKMKATSEAMGRWLSW